MSTGHIHETTHYTKTWSAESANKQVVSPSFGKRLVIQMVHIESDTAGMWTLQHGSGGVKFYTRIDADLRPECYEAKYPDQEWTLDKNTGLWAMPDASVTAHVYVKYYETD